MVALRAGRARLLPMYGPKWIGNERAAHDKTSSRKLLENFLLMRWSLNCYQLRRCVFRVVPMLAVAALVLMSLGAVHLPAQQVSAQGVVDALVRETRASVPEPMAPQDVASFTTVLDVTLPGTQPGGLHDVILDPDSCTSCHTTPIFERWRGSMMSQAGRDPVMRAALEVANKDADGVGDYCLRCHVPKGWMEGRSSPPDGSAMTTTDVRVGVACEICHRMVDPVPSANDQAINVDQAIRAQLALSDTLPPETSVGNAMIILDPSDNRRGPFDLPSSPPGHPAATYQTDLFRQDGDPVARSRVCGSCHNVANPTLAWTENPPDGAPAQFWPNEADTPPTTDAPSETPGGMFPIERTFDEWRASAYAEADGVYAPEFAGQKDGGRVGACPDCHMPRVEGRAVHENLRMGEYRDCETTGCLPEHELVGGNNWVPRLLQDTTWRLNASEDAYVLDQTVVRARSMLKRAATVTATLSTEAYTPTLTVRVINESGHKLPTGYPEGRRIWLNVKALAGDGEVVYESGKYDAATAVLTHDDALKVYEAKLGITSELADVLGKPAGESFHFVLNNTHLKDNRIPPRGYTIAAFDAPGLRPIGATYEDGQYWDETVYSLPATTQRVEVTLYYQTSSKEYIDFLRTNGGDDGAILGQMWDELKSPPEVMAELSLPRNPTYLPLLRR